MVKSFYRYTAVVLILMSNLHLLQSLYSQESENPGSRENNENESLMFFPIHPALSSYTWEIHSTVNRLELLNANMAPPHYPWSEGFNERIFLNIQLGIDIPIIGGENNRWLWYIGLPVSFNMIDDFFEQETAPVIDTDYWFGTKIESLYRLQLTWPKNISLRILPIFHESTHIGDEFALHMKDENPTDFYRINVSYEAWEIVAGLDEWESGRGNAFNLRLGMSGRWNTDGYYSTPYPSEIGSSLQPTSSYIIPSRGNLEYFGQFNTTIESGFPSFKNWVFQGGFELRNRILFDFFSTEAEKRSWTVNTSLGWYRYDDNVAARRIGFYMRLLAGQNPYGQFREQDGYFSFGAGISLGL